MAKTKDYKVTITDQQNEYIFSAKRKNAIYVKGIKQNDIDTNSFRIYGDNLLFSAKGKDFVVSNYTGIKYIKTDNASGKTDLLDIISHSYVDNTANVISTYNKKLTVTGATNYNDEIDMSGINNLTKTIKVGKKKQIVDKTSQDKGFTIKSGAGDDIITGSMYSDTITSGVGKNTIIVKNTEFGNDVINLTKNEELVIDLTECTDITDLSDLKYSIIGKNLIITVPEDDEYNKGTLTLKNYTKNILKSLSFKLYAQDTIIYNNLTEFTNDVVFNYNNSNLSKKRVLTGSAYNDKIDVENTTTKKYTINAGNGKNDITISSGTNVINSGKDNDTINISLDGNYTVNAGAGENTINIDNSDEFGTVIINEQKVNATNTIVLSDELINPEYKRVKNDMYIVDNNGTIILKNYYSNVKNKSTVNISFKDGTEQTLSEYISDTTMSVSGSGKIIGTDNNDIISINGKSSSTITPGKGNDTIGYSKGSRTFYLYEGDGNDIVEKGKGTDVLKFESGTRVIAETQYDIDGNTNLVVHYGAQGDSITFLDYDSKKKMYYYIGKKKYSFSISSAKGDLIEIDKYKTHYDGTNKNDTIIDMLKHTLEDTLTINGYGGDDYIDAHHDIVHAGSGNDYVHSINSFVYGEEGNDVIVNYGQTGGSGADIEIYGGDGDDTIVNEKYAYAKNLYGNDGNDIIINSGTVGNIIDGGNGADEISLRSGSKVSTVYGGNGDDTITIESEATVSSIYTNEGNDKINIEGSVGYIYCGIGDDIIIADKNSHIGTIYFNEGDGNDILDINKATLQFYTNSNLVYRWNNNDLILNYNDNENVTLKNYDINNNQIYIRGNYTYNTKFLLSDILKSGFVKLDIAENNIFFDDNDNNIIFDTTIKNIYTGDGNDKIILNENGVVGNNIYCGNGNNEIAILGYKEKWKSYDNNDNKVNNIYTGDGNDKVTINESAKVSNNIDCGAGDNEIYIYGSVNNIYTEDGNDKVIVDSIGSVDSIYLGDGNDEINITSHGYVGDIYTGSGNDIIITRSVSIWDCCNIWFYKGDGNDILDINNLLTTNLHFSSNTSSKTYIWQNDDLLIKYNNDRDSVLIKNCIPTSFYIDDETSDENSKNLLSTAPKKNIIGTKYADYLESNVYAWEIYGYDGNDTIINNGECQDIKAGNGNDTITNNGDVFLIRGDEGKDTIINNGKCYLIWGEDGDDNIINNGECQYIEGGKGNDIITITESSITNFINFNEINLGDGNDTLYLYASTSINCNLSLKKTYSWSKNDLVIKFYNNIDSIDSITIKNYDPSNKDIIVKIKTDVNSYRDLATLVPDKPTVNTLSLNMSNTNIDELNSQIATFNSASSTSDFSLTDDSTDMPSIMTYLTDTTDSQVIK